MPAAKTIAVVAMLALLAGACTGSSAGQIAEPPTVTETPAAAETETPTTTAPVETPTSETPTVEPTPAELSDDERIAAAVAEFEANPQPEGLFAYDILGTDLSGNGVIINLCAWTGETVFDEVRQATYRVDTEPNAAGEPDVTFESTTETPGECLNSTLVESALQATRDYDTFWGAVLDDPTTFDREEAANYLVESQLDVNTALVSQWADDGTNWRGHPFDGALPESSLQPVLWRRYERPDLTFDILELVVCRDLQPDYGLYKAELLVDDERNANSIGVHAVDLYQMTLSPEGWLIAGGDGLGWAECIDTDWLDGVTQWQPPLADWEPLR